MNRSALVSNLSGWAAIESQVQQMGLAVFLPAYNEADNLPHVVSNLVCLFKELNLPHSIIIVDDGSTDGTYEVAVQLASENPSVQIVRHNVNQGYGASLRDGSLAALQTEHGLVAFCDADNQFDVWDFPPLIEALLCRSVDFAVGCRVNRADSQLRRFTGGGWQMVCRFILGVEATDTDCGFKVFRREALELIAGQLRFNRGAAVNPEIFARAAKYGLDFCEVPVGHFSRMFGEQSGVNLNVILASAGDLLRLRAELWRKTVSTPERIVALESSGD